MDDAEEERALKVIVGLGNPEKKYALTRHNLGYMAVQALAVDERLVFKEERRFHGYVAKGEIQGSQVMLLLPTTFMNESGRALKALVDFYRVRPHNVLVVSDEVALEFETMRLRPHGSAGGHNGLKSIERYLGTHYYPRLRMGIGSSQAAGSALADFVLDNFSQEELQKLPVLLKEAVNVLKMMIEHGIAYAMQVVNKKQKDQNIEVRPTDQEKERDESSK